MSKKSAAQPVSSESLKEAMGIARARQRPGQSKEQTRLIARGIAEGIAEYRKSQKAKARELNRRLKKSAEPESGRPDQITSTTPGDGFSKRLPWVLLLASWVGFAIYLWLTR